MQPKAHERVTVTFAREELKAIEDFRFAQRMPNRAFAIRELLRLGLAADGVEVPSLGTNRWSLRARGRVKAG
jgi:hypothetical protein